MNEKNWDVWELKVLGRPFRWARLSILTKLYIPPRNARLIYNVWERNKRRAIKKAVWFNEM